MSRLDEKATETKPSVLDSDSAADSIPATRSQTDSRRRPFWKSALRVFRIPVYAYCGIVVVLLFLERSMIFFPDAVGDWNPSDVQFEEAWFESPDGEKLHGWFMEHPDPQAVILYLHGNGGNLTDRTYLIDHIRREMRTSVFIFDYRGYGKSSGKPNEPGVLMDARAARQWLSERTGTPEQEIVLLGRSLGGGVAVDLAAKDGARGLVLESTFTSLPDVGAVHYPWLPVRWAMRTRFDSLSKIQQYTGPVLQSHGTEDRTVPFELGERLFAAVPGPQKKFLKFPGYDHNDQQPLSYFAELDTFLSELPPTSGGRTQGNEALGD